MKENMVAGEGFEPSKVWGFTEIPRTINMVAGEGFEPSKAEPGDLQSPPIGRSGNPPGSYKCCGNYGSNEVKGYRR